MVRLLRLRLGGLKLSVKEREREGQVEQAFSVFVCFIFDFSLNKTFSKMGSPSETIGMSTFVLLANLFASRVLLIDRNDRCCRENADEYARTHSIDIDDPVREFLTRCSYDFETLRL